MEEIKEEERTLDATKEVNENGQQYCVKVYLARRLDAALREAGARVLAVQPMAQPENTVVGRDDQGREGYCPSVESDVPHVLAKQDYKKEADKEQPSHVYEPSEASKKLLFSQVSVGHGCGSLG
jgi:hypothetical protein